VDDGSPNGGFDREDGLIGPNALCSVRESIPLVPRKFLQENPHSPKAAPDSPSNGPSNKACISTFARRSARENGTWKKF